MLLVPPLAIKSCEGTSQYFHSRGGPRSCLFLPLSLYKLPVWAGSGVFFSSRSMAFWEGLAPHNQFLLFYSWTDRIFQYSTSPAAILTSMAHVPAFPSSQPLIKDPKRAGELFPYPVIFASLAHAQCNASSCCHLALGAGNLPPGYWYYHL